MAEKQSFVQIVDRVTGNVERVADLKEIEALSVEDKLALARSKTLYVVSHKLEPVIKVEMRKVSISAPVSYQEHPAEQPVPVKVEKVEKPVEKAKPVKPFKEEKVEKQAEIAIKPVAKGRPKKNS